jgi:hypothetical protein
MRILGRLWLFSAMVTGFAGGAHAFIYNIVSQMYHGGGAANGSELWELNIPGTNQVYLSYGPYATDIPSGENLIVTRVIATPAAGSKVSLLTEALDRNQGIYYAPAIASATSTKYLALGSMVNMPANGNWEFYLKHLGGGKLGQLHVLVLTASQNLDRAYLPATDQAGFHAVGNQVAGTDMWEAYPGSAGCNPSCTNKYLSYGPYTTLAKGPGPHVADFRLSINSTAPSTEKVATVDILFRKSDGTVVSAGGRDVYRGDFSADNQLTDILLEFENPVSFSRDWEFRVRWTGKGVIRQERTLIYKVF